MYDAIRGLCVISMAGFHYCYDLVELAGVDLGWFRPPFENVWRASISWSFLFLAGLMCSYSRNNLRRSVKYGLVALLIWAVTTIAAVDIPISFGIIFCMAASTLVYALLQRARIAPRGFVAALALFVLFVCALGVPRGIVQLGSFKLALPGSWYSTE
ncbi:heparan-alpha-glucosaminide N-acetyltransferase domain-containing protein, partial [Paratractidigestivibacter sp.]|uniref:heparan-alpha-glucosaminide N-acetyltransferase domain-containing protein n=1 Tax=Paratractidigestivibacter sp. TaxID=2847316 RepID=UPI0040267F85